MPHPLRKPNDPPPPLLPLQRLAKRLQSYVGQRRRDIFGVQIQRADTFGLI